MEFITNIHPVNMNKSILYAILLLTSASFGCNQNNSQNTKEAIKKPKETVISKACYSAIDEDDIASLTYETLSNGKIKGNMVINYKDKGKNDGTIEGKFRGDTLFVDYTFKIGTENPTVYKNPLALLKKDSTLVLGVGQIETYLGKSDFVKGKEIRFDRSRFIFSPTACKK
jgi:hypothetical protein